MCLLVLAAVICFVFWSCILVKGLVCFVGLSWSYGQQAWSPCKSKRLSCSCCFELLITVQVLSLTSVRKYTLAAVSGGGGGVTAAAIDAVVVVFGEPSDVCFLVVVMVSSVVIHFYRPKPSMQLCVTRPSAIFLLLNPDSRLVFSATFFAPYLLPWGGGLNVVDRAYTCATVCSVELHVCLFL